MDGPHSYKGQMLEWHLNIERPGAVPGSLKGLDHVNLPKGLQALAPLTSAQNLSRISKGATVVSVGIDTYRLGEAYVEDGYTVGANTAMTAGSVAGDWAGAWLGAKGGAATGAAIGAPAGPVGAAAGGVVGGIGGAIAGGFGGSMIGEELAEWIYGLFD